MIRRAKDRVPENRVNMRGGAGTVIVTPYCDASEMKNCRILAEMTVPPGAGVGQHEHIGESEYYLILAGQGIVDDNGSESIVYPGDVIVTGGGAFHAIRNEGKEHLRLIAIIITEQNA